MSKLVLGALLTLIIAGCGGLTESRQEASEAVPPVMEPAVPPVMEPAAVCAPSSLDVSWPVIPGCMVPKVAKLPERPDIWPLRCAFSRSITQPAAEPFVSCCPRASPFSCANGTPASCYATAREAAAACADACQQCSEFSPLDGN